MSLKASWTGSRFPIPTNDPSMVFCYTGEVDGSGNLIDFSGENLLAYRTEFDQWTEDGTCAVTADQWRSPVSGLMTADLLDNTADPAGFRYGQVAVGAAEGKTYTGSVWIRADYDHTVTLRIADNDSLDTSLNVSVTKMWQRFSISGLGTTLATDIYLIVYPGEANVIGGQAYFSDAQLVENDEYHTNMGPYLNPAVQTVTKPNHDLAPTNSLTRALADVESQGNRLPGRNFVAASTQYYSKAHHASMNVNDSDHTYTFYIKATDTTQRRFFEHGTYQADGIYFEMLGSGSEIIRAQYNSSGSNAAVSYTGIDPEDQNRHIVQLVRDSDTATVYIDGNAGTPVDVSGEGIDGSKTLYIGNSVTGSTSWDGDISFAKLTARAMTPLELAQERDALLGMTAGGTGQVWDVARDSVAYKTFNAGGAHAIDSKMTEVAANMPRITADGLLVEGESTSLLDYSEQFNMWSTSQASTTQNTHVALDGSTTADTLVENGVNGFHTWYRSYTVTSGTTYTFSVFAGPLNRDWLQLYIGDAGTMPRAWFNVTEGRIGTASNCTAKMTPYPGGYYRCSITWTASASALRYYYVGAADADASTQYVGANQDSVYAWGAQFEEGTFPTSYIEVPSTASITRQADDITMDPHESGTNLIVLPDLFTAGQADKLTISFEAKCQWSGAADIGTPDRSFVDISGNTGTAERLRNRVNLQVNSDGRLFAFFRDDSSTMHYVRTGADHVDYSQWNSFRFVLDFADLSRMDLWINGNNSGLTYDTNTGTGVFDTSGTKIRIGQQYNGVVEGNMQIRNLQIIPAEIRPE